MVEDTQTGVEQIHEGMIGAVAARFDRAKTIRSNWSSLWQDCYDYALPNRSQSSLSRGRADHLYDATALDAVDELASMLLGYLTPPMTPWFAIKAGTDVTDEDAQKLAPLLDQATRVLQAHFDQSNFLVEIHQCFLDLVVSGTASLAFEESEPGDLSAFRFAALPMSEISFLEGRNGYLDVVFRELSLSSVRIRERYGYIETDISTDQAFEVIECILPMQDGAGYFFIAYLKDSLDVISVQKVSESPYINFRWMKSPGEVYGRSPVMKALPDIKTANKVVELILKNASIAVTGIWQADDDGVINPATIQLVPGAIIPKAVGSKGLTPLEMPSRFDVSQLVLEDLRARIRHALLVDRLPAVGGGKMTATEITERTGQIALLLGATFGRLQVELLNPLLQRAYQILRDRGSVPDLPLDGRTLAIEYRSPLARAQSISRHLSDGSAWHNL